ncbi:hypothetical protein BT69DRAFT_1329587 [Atractiella rhizophila]|nr:hypothetical protein BT69DRAFT_1329587 [Atractiella rhizophila]
MSSDPVPPKKKRNPRIVLKDKRWELGELNSGGYSSSRQLEADISKIRRRRRLNDLTTPSSNDGNKPKSRPRERVSKTRQGHASHASLKGKRAKKEEPQEIELADESHLRAIKPLLEIFRVGSSSPDARLANIQLACSLGDHLMLLSASEIRLRVSVNSEELPVSWSNYHEMKTGQEEMNKYAELYVALRLAVGAEKTNHSAILGSSFTPTIPPQTLADDLLDLRPQGHARSYAHLSLVMNCLEKVLHPSSPLRQVTPESLEYASLIMYLLSNLQPTREMLELMKIIWRCFLGLFRAADLEGKKKLLGKYFELLFVYDVKFHAYFNEVPALSDAEGWEIAKHSENNHQFFLDPFAFATASPSAKQHENTYWCHLWSVARYLSGCMMRLRRDDFSQTEAENAASTIYDFLVAFRQWRSSSFSPTGVLPSSQTPFPPLIIYIHKHAAWLNSRISAHIAEFEDELDKIEERKHIFLSMPASPDLSSFPSVFQAAPGSHSAYSPSNSDSTVPTPPEAAMEAQMQIKREDDSPTALFRDSPPSPKLDDFPDTLTSLFVVASQSA